MDARALSGERPLSAAPRITVLVPAWNEAESIPVFHREVVAALEALGQPWEVIYVDDGSRDGTGDAIAKLAAADSRVRGVSLRRNFGKSAALATGFDLARGEWVVTMDADLQDDPAELPRLVEQIENGYDLVSGWKQNRKDPITKTSMNKEAYCERLDETVVCVGIYKRKP